MILTIKANNGSFANFASVQVQPLPPSHPLAQAQTQTLTLTHPSSTGLLSAHEVPLSVPVLMATTPSTFQSTNTFQTISKPSLSQITTLLTTTPQFILPVTTRFNQIVPTFNLNLDAGRTYDPRLAKGFVTTTTKFQPYEQLTGIAHERPEIVMLTNFQPLFDRDVSHTAPSFVNYLEDAGEYRFMTDAGRYIDSQFNMRSLQVVNYHQQLRVLRERYPFMTNTFTQRKSDFSQALDKLKDDSSFLLNLIRILETQKHQLDLRHDIYVVEPTPVVTYLFDNFTRYRQTLSPVFASKLFSFIDSGLTAPAAPVARLVEIGLPKNYDVPDCLTAVGYTSDSVRNVFSSTKLWLQLLAELKSILRHHSLKFLDIDPTYQRNDNNPTSVNIPPVKYFDLADNLPSLPTLDDLINLGYPTSNGSFQTAFQGLRQAYGSLYQNVFFRNEEARIAALALRLSQEYRYSVALTEPSVQQLLTQYGFAVTPTSNASVFDAVLGNFGNNISDLPAATDQSLASAAYNTTSVAAGQQAGVLNFESKYVEGDTGTLTPGGDFYFDRVLETDGKSFNTSAMSDLSAALQTQGDRFNSFIDVFNLLSAPRHTDNRNLGGSVDFENNFLANGQDIIWELADRLINRQGVVLPAITADRLGAVYALARTNNDIKTWLFMYTLAKISRSYISNVPFFNSNKTADNTPLVDYLIQQVTTTMETTVPQSRSTIQLVTQRGLDGGLNTASLTSDTIAHALKSGTAMTALIEGFMSSVVSQFRNKTQAIQGNFSKYSGLLDTIIMMMAFDFAIAMIARYTDQKIVGKYSGLTTYSTGQTIYALSQVATNHQTSFNEVIQRLSGEETVTRQLVLAVVNVMRNYAGSLKGNVNYLTSNDSVNKLQEIAKVLNNDPTAIRMLFSEQQIQLFASTVASLVGSVDQDYSNDTVSNRGNQVGTHASDQTANEIAILDETEVAPALYQALLGYFGTGDFASQRGMNKHVLTVGIPLGFTQRLKQKINIQQQKRASFTDKKNDIVQVTVYKVDMQNADVIFKPVRFLFEMARFPTRFGTGAWLPLRDNPGINDIINAIPTQCFTSNLDAGTANSITSGIEYASTSIANSDGTKAARSAFDSADYAFLSSQQKGEILHNHVVSQLLETYIKLMTGINVSEYNYHMTDPAPPMESSFVGALTQHTLDHIATHIAAQNATQSVSENNPPAGGILFATTGARTLTAITNSQVNKTISHPMLSNPAGVAGSVSAASLFRGVQPASPTTKTLAQSAAIAPINSSLAGLSHRHVPLTLATLKTISNLSNTLSTLSTPDALNQRVLSPKQFDRVFNIVIDARDFDIDVEKTQKTPFGRQALDLLIQHGDVVPGDSNFLGINFSFNRFSTLSQIGSTGQITGGRSFPQGRFNPNINNYRFRDRDKNQGDLITDKYFVTIETLDEEDQV